MSDIRLLASTLLTQLKHDSHRFQTKEMQEYFSPMKADAKAWRLLQEYLVSGKDLIACLEQRLELKK